MVRALPRVDPGHGNVEDLIRGRRKHILHMEIVTADPNICELSSGPDNE